MARKYFGTDGIRGRANGVITAELALKVGQAVGLIFQAGDHRHRVLIGKDTRLSGYMMPIENCPPPCLVKAMKSPRGDHTGVE